MKTPGKLTVILFVAWILNSCGSGNIAFIENEIKGDWEFRQTNDTNWYPAKVPGTVHQDLLALNLIPDPFIGLNDKKVQWVENHDWEYKTTFNIGKDVLSKENVELIFEGLDTYASVFINNKLILSADNMFRSWSVPVKDFLQEGENSLSVLLKSPVAEGMKKLQANGYSIPANGELTTDINKRTSPFTRKAPFHYAWDWAPRLVTSGIWKPIHIRAWNNAKIDEFYLKQQNITENLAQYNLMLGIEATKSGSLRAILKINDEIVSSEEIEVKAGKNNVSLSFGINQPRLWWTNGLGESYLYKVNIQLTDGETIVDDRNTNLGVRSLELVQEKDSIGQSFYFKLNGVPVFMKGADYIPNEQLLPKVSHAEYERLIKTAVEANMNMFRICGCTIYEQDDFYDLCDKYGILVWQDFMFACNMVPSQEDHLLNIEKEAQENVIRLRNHPSLALWCGNNENYVGWNYWNWKQRYGFSSADSAVLWHTYEKVFFDILPDAVSSLDPDRSYWPSSPKNSFKDPINRVAGDQHDWGVWFEQMPYESYAETFGRFVSEYGLQAYPPLNTIKSFAGEDQLDMNSEVMRHRQRCREEWEELPGADGNDIILRYINRYYQAPKDFASLVYLSQVVQAETYKSALTSHHRNMPRCMGSLYWQFNDCWPTISWASLDYYGNWKASLYKVKDANKPIILTFAKTGENDLDLYIVSDKLEDVNATLEIRLLDFDGAEIWKQEENVTVKANKSEIVLQEIAKSLPAFDPKRSYLVARLYVNNQQVTEDFYYFRLVKDLVLPEYLITTRINKTENGYKIILSGNRFCKNCYLSLPDKNGHFSDNFFDLIPGEQKELFLISNDPDIKDSDILIATIKDTY